LKTRRGGFDGRGQVVVRDPGERDDGWKTLGGRRCVLEAWVPFTRELSLVAVRAADGELRCYPLVENVHADGILRRTTAPEPSGDGALQRLAERHVHAILDRLDYVGVAALELFHVGDDLVANELAPRVHNSGHWTIEGAETSQFENHVRAVAGLPLGSTAARGPAVMLNLIGDLPPVDAVLRIPGAHVHLYGKQPRPARKLGHVTVTAPDGDHDELAARVRAVESALGV
jgi:5-(carboxyamino)imidazole ribonucleotide synthase